MHRPLTTAMACVLLASLSASCDRSPARSTPPWTPNSTASASNDHDRTSTHEPHQVANLRRLTRDELAGTFRALIDQVPESLSRLPPDATDVNAAAPPVSSFEVEVYRAIAEEAAQAGAPKLLAGWHCEGRRGQDCLQRAASAWIEMAQRRPLADAERTAYLSAFERQSDNTQAVRDMLGLVFQSPQFL